MALTTEALIKRALTRLFKLVIRWYKEHPEGRKDPKLEIDCYGSATFGLRVSQGEEKAHKIATITLDTGFHKYLNIESALNRQYIDCEETEL